MDSLPELVAAYVEAHDKQKALAAEAREHRKRTKELHDRIVEVMEAEGLDECGLSSGARIVKKETRRTEGLKKEHIQGELKKLVGSDVGVEEAVANMYNRRLTDVLATLSVVKPGLPEQQES